MNFQSRGRDVCESTTELLAGQSLEHTSIGRVGLVPHLELRELVQAGECIADGPGRAKSFEGTRGWRGATLTCVVVFFSRFVY